MANLLTSVEQINYNSNQLMLGLVIGVTLLVFLVVKTKIHAFMALIITALLIALIGGVQPGTIPSIITNGFGNTLGSIGIIIGLGVILGKIFETSGAADRMALTFIKLFGQGRENLALSVTGFIVSIPVFCDSAFIILFPIAKAISEKTRKNLVTLAGSLAIGLILTHSLVPPTPGPLAAAQEFGVDLGAMISLSILIALPMMFVTMAYIKWFGNNCFYLAPVPNTDKITLEREEEDMSQITLLSQREDLPSAFLSFLPIILPILLILIQNVISLLHSNNTISINATILSYIQFIGHPIVAVCIGVVIAIYTLTLKQDRLEILNSMDTGIKSAGIILLVTGGGGALGQVIKDTGLGNDIAKNLTLIGIPFILLPFIIATIVRFVQGSGTVAIITSASISAPIILAANESGANVNPTLAALAACIGSLFFSYFNDSYFHVVNRSIGISDTKMQVRFWSISSTIAWATGGLIIIILSLFM